MSSQMTRHVRTAPVRIGQQAAVIGAGVGGLAAAAVLADWFDRVVLIERDGPADGRVPRPGTPQAWHCHGLLGGGQAALDEIFPGIEMDFVCAGAVLVRCNQDFREELADGTPMPQRDVGLHLYTMSRSLLEQTLLRRVLELPNVLWRFHTQALRIRAGRGGQRVTGIEYVRQLPQVKSAGAVEALDAELVVDATAQGALTPALLEALGQRPIPCSRIGVDLNYTTATFAANGNVPDAVKCVLTRNRVPSSRRSLAMAVENGRWMISVVGCRSERPGGDWAGVLAHLQQLPTRTIYSLAQGAQPLGEPSRFGLRDSIWRHFERVVDWPDGLIPVGDTICRFNPLHGQGMKVAAKEAILIKRLLEEASSRPDPIQGLGRAFLCEAKLLIETPWNQAAIPDLALPDTRGERPAGLERSLKFGKALQRLAARDEEVHRLTPQVWHLLKPKSAVDDPVLVHRVQAEIKDMEQSPGV